MFFLLFSFLWGRGNLWAFEIHDKFKTITIDDGLSQNMVNAIIQDSKGYMWIGTKDGLNRYDGYSFKIFKKETDNNSSLGDNNITALYEDDQQRLWVGTKFGGLHIYDEKNHQFTQIQTGLPSDETHLISSITGNSKDGIWISCLNGNIFGFSISPTSENSIPKISLTTKISPKELNYTIPESIYLDVKGRLWIPSNIGIRRYDLHSQKLDTLLQELTSYSIQLEHPPIGVKRLDNENAPTFHRSKNIFVDESNHNLWIPSHHGVYRIDLIKSESILYQCSGGVITALPSQNSQGEDILILGTHTNGVLTLNLQTFHLTKQLKDKELEGDGILTQAYKSKDGSVWLATNGRGIVYYSPNFNLFSNPLPQILKNHPKLSTSVYGVHKLKQKGKSYLMINTLSYTLIKDEESQSIHIDTSLHVKTAKTDDKDKLWVGTNIGLITYDLSKHTFLEIDTIEKIISGLHIDKHNTIWYTTPYLLKEYRPQTKEFRQYVFYDQLKDNNHQLKESLYSCIEVDIDGTYWLGTANGLFHFDPTKKKFIPIKNSASHPFIDIKSVKVDHLEPNKYIWIGTPLGLHRLEKNSGKYIVYTTRDGLSNNTVYGILTDEQGNLWMSTNKGISVFDPKTESFLNFDVSNGLQSNEFNTGAYNKDEKGQMYFGGIRGYNQFFPEQIQIPFSQNTVQIAEIRILGENNSPGLAFLSQNNRYKLKHNQNNIHITLTALQYASPEKVMYAYRIYNQDTTWIKIGNNRNINLTNLRPGKYVFQAKSTDIFGKWNSEYQEETFYISPPWWGSLLAKIFYVLLSISLIYAYWMLNKRRIMEANQREMEQKQAATLLELDRVKSRFLTNITHEFRTPLTLINGHIERMKEEYSHPHLSNRIQELETNSHRLLQLINQLMDLSKLDSGEYQLYYQKSDLLQDYNIICASFSSFAEQKAIHLNAQIDEDTQQFLTHNKVIYSKEAFLTILNNLLSNACKFTPVGGSIDVSFHYDPEEEIFTLQVADNGPGIQKDHLDKIFDRFFQSDSAIHRKFEGSGVGLSLVKELTELHGGKVQVKSELDKGTTFIVTFREGKLSLYSSQNENDNIKLSKRIVDHVEIVATDEDDEKPLILLVEDHPDIRKFIRETLGVSYRYLEENNGRKGLESALNNVPDLIISDVMMPEMDGIEMCRLIKKSEITSHIPVILLTARSQHEDKLEGLETGADEYLSKPFSSKELKLRTSNILNLQKKWRSKILQGDNSLEEIPADRSMDVLFLDRIKQLILIHLEDRQFGVEQLAAECNLSSVQLKRKLKNISGFNTVAFIQKCRMDHALELLKDKNLSISQIAEKTGFDEASYFSKVFKKHFGSLPSEMRSEEEGS